MKATSGASKFTKPITKDTKVGKSAKSKVKKASLKKTKIMKKS